LGPGKANLAKQGAGGENAAFLKAKQAIATPLAPKTKERAVLGAKTTNAKAHAHAHAFQTPAQQAPKSTFKALLTAAKPLRSVRRPSSHKKTHTPPVSKDQLKREIYRQETTTGEGEKEKEAADDDDVPEPEYAPPTPIRESHYILDKQAYY
ncbi:hypothetical protein KEM52_003458, partial [Ascosphaera acerosa]